MDFGKIGIRNKLILIFLPLILISLLIISFILGIVAQSEIRSDFYKTSTKTLKHISSSFEMYFKTVMDNCKYLANHPLVKNCGKNITTYTHLKKQGVMKPYANSIKERKIYSLYKRFGEAHKNHAYVYMATNYQGYIQYPAGTIMKEYYPTKRPYYINAMKNKDKVSMSTPYYFEADNIHIISVVTPIKRNGKIIGVQGIDVSLIRFHQILSEIRIMKTGRVVAVDKTGRIVSYKKNPGEKLKTLKTIGIDKKDFKNTTSGYFNINLKGVDYICTYYYSKVLDFRFLALIKNSELLNRVYRMRNGILMITSGFIILLIPLIVIIAFSMTRPLNHLIHVIREFKGGVREIRANINTHDEIGELSQTFNILADEIKSELNALENEKNKLEIRVIERTQELFEMNQKILNSIEYAKRIQTSVLPDHDLIRKYTRDYFVIWQPRDSVGGDFYFFQKVEDVVLIAVVDCTGHGVPGAMMTMLVSAISNRIDLKYRSNPAEYLKEINVLVRALLKHDVDDKKDLYSDDGLDMGLCFYNPNENVLNFAGAKISLFYNEEGEMKRIKGDKQSIGYRESKENYVYKNHEINLSANTNVYMTSDGFLDQNGGHKNFSFGKKRFIKVLKRVFDLPMNEQKNEIIKTLNDYKGDKPQRDDITVIGIKF